MRLGEGDSEDETSGSEGETAQLLLKYAPMVWAEED